MTKYSFSYFVFRISYFVFRISYFVFRISYFVFRISYTINFNTEIYITLLCFNAHFLEIVPY